MIDFDVQIKGAKRNDWKKFEEPDPDDEELDKTPKDVVAILGFDPKEIEE